MTAEATRVEFYLAPANLRRGQRDRYERAADPGLRRVRDMPDLPLRFPQAVRPPTAAVSPLRGLRVTARAGGRNVTNVEHAGALAADPHAVGILQGWIVVRWA
jgi:hypothetical protein